MVKKEGSHPYVGVGSAARGGMSGHRPGGGVVFDPSGGGRRKFFQGGDRGGTKVKFSSCCQRWPKNCQFLLAL